MLIFTSLSTKWTASRWQWILLLVLDWLLRNSLALNPDKPSVATEYNPSDDGWCINSYVRSHEEPQDHNWHITGFQPAYHDYLQTSANLALRVVDQSTVNAVACGIVGIRLDYCNALLAVMSGLNLDKLQHVQNCLARLVTGAHHRDHMKLVLNPLDAKLISAKLL